MDRDAFSADQCQHLKNLGEDGWAFIPPNLPPDIDLAAIALLLAQASAAVGELNGAARRLTNPFMLIRPLLHREALSSSAMEGTITTLGDMILEESGDSKQASDDAREVTNYVRAVTTGVELLQTLPISHRLIRETHKVLLSGLSRERGAKKRPGEYKQSQNAVGRRGDSVRTARYVPPPPAQTISAMDALEAYVNREIEAPAMRLVDLALVHYQFEAIHPFDDGNGRIGRLLVTLQAMQSGLLDLPLLHMSAFMENRKDVYIDSMFRVSTAGDWTQWLAFFLSAVEHTAVEAIAIVDEILKLNERLKNDALNIGKSPRLALIVEGLFEQLWTTVSLTQERCNVSFPTARNDLRALVDAGILREIDGTKSRLYFCPAILALADRPKA